MEKNKEYKGIFYKSKTKHKYYEAGAHFSYKDLFKKLSEIKDELNGNRETEKLSSYKESELDTVKNNVKNEAEEIRIIKKLDIPILSKKQNNSMADLFNENMIKMKESLDNIFNYNILKDKVDSRPIIV